MDDGTMAIKCHGAARWQWPRQLRDTGAAPGGALDSQAVMARAAGWLLLRLYITNDNYRTDLPGGD